MATYFGLVALLRVVPRDDIALLRQAIARRRAPVAAEELGAV
jgi:hypothetical protein